MNKIKSILGSGLMLLLLSGCQELILLHPKGVEARDERDLIYTALILMLLVVIPAIILACVFAYRYRESNHKATYAPEWHHSNKIEAVVWGVPIAIILVLGTITWKSTHYLDPYRTVEVPGVQPLTIQVVALDWKWLFIYPEQNIATVNFVQLPVGTPVDFKITSDAPMNSFMIPQLAGQIYAMAGMQTHLHIVAETPGDYDGRSVSYSGRGFSDMTFIARVSSADEFKQWVNEVKRSNNVLSAAVYKHLALPSEREPRQFYSAVQSHLYDNIIMKYMMPGMDDLSVDHSSMQM